MTLLPTAQSNDAEALFLGVLLDSQFHDKTSELVAEVSEEDFEAVGHREVYRAISSLVDEGVLVEPFSVVDRMHEKPGVIKGEEARALVMMIHEDRSYSVAGSHRYVKAIREASTRRKLMVLSKRIAEKVEDSSSSPDDLLATIGDEVYSLHDRKERGGFIGPKELTDTVIERITDMEAKPPGTRTGFSALDRTMGRMTPGSLIVVAARPSMGKTAFALAIGENVVKAGGTVGMFSMEMSGDEIQARRLAARAKVDSLKVYQGDATRFSKDELSRLLTAGDQLRTPNFFVDQSEKITVGSIRANAQRLQARHGLDLIIVDYIQLMCSSLENRTNEVAVISRNLKMVARELNVPIMALSQLNRGPESRPDKRPLMSDIRDSGAVEQDADVVLILYRDEYYNQEESLSPGQAEVNVSKNRKGPTGTVQMSFQAKFALFSDLARPEEVVDF